MLSVRGIHSVTSSLRFEVVGLPPAGSVLCLTDHAEAVELLHLASDPDAAATWAARHPFARARFERVNAAGEPTPLELEVDTAAAA